jgi:xanthine dehydrogenase accessory factor
MQGLKRLEACLRRDQVAVRVNVARARGSVPREEGAYIIVTDNDLSGTIGGGALEYQAIAIARDMLTEFKQATTRQVPRARLEAFPLGAELAQCCGGNVTLLFELMSAELDLEWISEALRHLEAGTAVMIELKASAQGQITRKVTPASRPKREDSPGLERDGHAFRYIEAICDADTPLWVYGAGHVGQALVRVLNDTPFSIRWIDERPDPWPRPQESDPSIERPPDAAARATTAPDGAFHLIMTHSHDLDYRIVRGVLLDARFGWLGLIGSETKATCFRIRLARDGVADAQIARLVSPIGLDVLQGAGKAPAVIAVGVAAQLLLARKVGAGVATPTHPTATLA